jgi:hypothetical protein
MVYVHNNLRLIYRQREEWVKGKTKMWDVFPDDMGLDKSVELALANLDLNDPVLEPVTFDDGDPLEGSSSTTIDAQIALDIEEEEERRAVMRTLILMIMSWRTSTTESWQFFHLRCRF